MSFPTLMITYNRLEYTKRALAALIESDCGDIILIDNASTDGTLQFLCGLPTEENGHKIYCYNNSENIGIAGAMNKFLDLTRDIFIVGKVDNDTIVPKDWCARLKPCLDYCDMVQPKHYIIPATDPGGWDSFVKHMKEIRPGLYQHHFIGGSGILFKRNCIDEIPATKWKLGGWREFQKFNPALVKCFFAGVEIKLLDEHGYTDYPDYYKQTKRLQ